MKGQKRISCLKEQAKQRNNVTEDKDPIVWIMSDECGLLIDVNRILLSLVRK